MNRLPLSLVAHWAGGELHGDDVAIDAVSHDTRQLRPGSLYVALRGERFDGHDFAAGTRAACMHRSEQNFARLHHAEFWRRFL